MLTRLIVIFIAVFIAIQPPATAQSERAFHITWCSIVLLGLAAAVGIPLGYREYEKRQLEEKDDYSFFRNEQNLCCFCKWERSRECEELRTQTACERWTHPTRRTPDCTWDNGVCKSRFELACAEWRSRPLQRGCIRYGSQHTENFSFDALREVLS